MSLKAIDKMFHNSEREGVIIHNNVIELPRISANKRYKCLCCQKEWVESVNSPIVHDGAMVDEWIGEGAFPKPTLTCVEFYKPIEKELAENRIELREC